MKLQYARKMVPMGYLLTFLSVLVVANSDGHHCVMRGNCDIDDMTGLKKPCVYNGSSVALTDPTAIDTLRDYCPGLTSGPSGEVCCDADQIDLFKRQLETLGSLFQCCPSCFYNLANLLCQLNCSPKQSHFLEVTASTSNSVDEMSYYITEQYATGLFDSCKNVKLASTTSRAIEICCGDKGPDCTPHDWLEYVGRHDPSPYRINFHFENSDSVTAKGKSFHPMNETIIPCSKAVNKFGIPCSCVDCPPSCRNITKPKYNLSPLKNSDGHCVMRGNCDIDDMTGLMKPCVYNGSAIALTDPTAIDTLRDYCPGLTSGPSGEVCCDADQIDLFKRQLETLGSLFQHCPSCFYNLANLVCQLNCSPKQSHFLEVTASTSNSVDEMSYYITEQYATGLFDSCKNVKLASTTSRAIEICCGDKGPDCTPHDWLEYIGGHDPSPYQINFHFENSDSKSAKGKSFHPMNETIITCSKAVNKFGIPCSCVDCPPSCTNIKKRKYYRKNGKAVHLPSGRKNIAKRRYCRRY